MENAGQCTEKVGHKINGSTRWSIVLSTRRRILADCGGAILDQYDFMNETLEEALNRELDESLTRVIEA